jgi:hypothetical protein
MCARYNAETTWLHHAGSNLNAEVQNYIVYKIDTNYGDYITTIKIKNKTLYLLTTHENQLIYLHHAFIH